MKIHREVVVWNDIQIVCVVRNLMCIHNRARNFDRAHKVKVVVTQMVCKLLNLLVGQRGRILSHIIVHRQSGGNGGLVRNHVEVESTISRMLYEACIDNRSRGRISIIVALTLSKSCIDPFINKSIQQLWLVTLLIICDTFAHSL